METICNALRCLLWCSVLGLGVCSVPHRVAFTQVYEGGATGHITLRSPHPINGWTIHLHFNRPVTHLEVWNAKVRHLPPGPHHDFVIENLDWDAHVNAHHALTLSFLLSGDIHSSIHGNYTTSVDAVRSTTLATTTPPSSTSASEATSSIIQTSSTTSSTTTNSSTTTTSSTTIAASSTTTSTGAATSRASTTSTLSSPLTSANPPALNLSIMYTCNKVAAIQAVGNHINASSANANRCEDGISGSNEDLILSTCNAPKPDTWHRGPKVMDSCNQIPWYTPIATFIGSGSDVYAQRGAQSGIFVGCLPTGFRLIVQHCNAYPVIEHIEQGGILTQDPGAYFVLV